MSRIFDVVVVGAGAAGCVLAGRLSENSGRTVLLIEAGDDAAPGQEHPDVLNPYPLVLGNMKFFWPDLIAETGVDPGNGRQRGSRHFLQGLGVGGGSNINGMNALRGQPEDYDQWVELGADGWGWDGVLPYFKKLERDLDFSGPLHGDSGPIPIRRMKPADWAPFAKAVGDAVLRRGYRQFADYNADFEDGLSAMPISNLPDRRVSTSMGYLTAQVRQRPNLVIRSNAYAERIVFDRRKTTGIVIRTAGISETIAAREIIVSCGALYSPALLLRSGVGPAEDLRATGIDVVHHLAGVGANLQNHPQLVLAAYLPRKSTQPAAYRSIGQNCLRYSSKLPGCAPHDMGLAVINKTSWHALGKRIGAIAPCLYEPHSKGRVSFASNDLGAPPKVQFNLLADERDFTRIVQGLRFALELLDDDAVRRARKEVFLPNAKSVGELNRRSSWNAVQSLAAVGLFEIDAIRRAFLKTSILDTESLVKNEKGLVDFVRQRTGMSHHVSGTCKIGPDADPMAVLDSACQVRGVEGLRVVDPSAFPRIPRAGMHIPVIMAAEKMADQIKSGH